MISGSTADTVKRNRELQLIVYDRIADTIHTETDFIPPADDRRPAEIIQRETEQQLRIPGRTAGAVKYVCGTAGVRIGLVVVPVVRRFLGNIVVTKELYFLGAMNECEQINKSYTVFLIFF
jgi:hypothetical protein